jgi:hypothetical protein
MSNATIIGSASEFNGVTTFKSQPIITSAILANTDSSTNIATTAWSNAFWTYVKTQANTFSGTTTLGTTNTETITAPTTTSNMTIGTNLNGGSVTIGATSTTTINGTTAINIGTSATQTGNIAIGTNNAVLSGTNQIFIGASNKTTIINGATNINTTGSATTSIGNILSTTNISGSGISIADSGLSATGFVKIATGPNATGSYFQFGSSTLDALYLRSTNIYINDSGGNTKIGLKTSGVTDIFGSVNIANTGLAANTGVNIATGTNSGTGTFVTIGSQTLPDLYVRSAITHINDIGGILALGSSTSSIRLYSPLEPWYSISFTSGQIGYTSSTSASGSLINGTYNNLLMSALTGVYMIYCKSYVAAGSFSGVNTYDFQLGLNGIGEVTRSYLGGSSLNYSNNQQSLSMVYSSSGPTNPNSALLYSNVYINFNSYIGSPIWGITLYYTRIA